MTPSQPAAGESLPLGLLAAYALPALPLAALQLPLFVLLPAFYAEQLGLGLALVGAVLMAVRLFDMASDPLVGWMSDNLHTPFGRRRPWIALGAPLLMLSVWYVMAPPENVTWVYLLGWMLLLSLATTLVTMPHQAWGAELSPDYHERSRISGAREGATVLGLLLALSIPALAGEDQAQALLYLGIFIVVLVPPSLFIALWRTPDRAVAKPPPLTLSRSWATLRDNKPFRYLIAAYLLNGIANGLPATLFVLYVTQVLGLAFGQWVGPLLLVYFLSAVAAVPLWVWLARRLGKHRAWIASMLFASAAFAPAAFLGQGDVIFFTLICVLTGVALGGEQILPPAIQADVVDLDTLQTGRRRTGLYFALWGMATKLALALAAGLAFPLLELSGFDREAGTGLWALAALYGALPIAFKLGSIWLLRGFPLDAARQAEIRRRIEDGEAGETGEGVRRESVR